MRTAVAKGSPVHAVWPRQGAVALYSPIAETAAAHNAAAAQSFLRYVLSTTVSGASALRLAADRARRTRSAAPPAAKSVSPDWTALFGRRRSSWTSTAHLRPVSLPPSGDLVEPRLTVRAAVVAFVLVVLAASSEDRCSCSRGGPSRRSRAVRQILASHAPDRPSRIRSSWRWPSRVRAPVGAALTVAFDRALVGRPAAWMWALALPLLVPEFALTFGWTQAYGRGVSGTSSLGLRLPGLYGPAGIALVLAVDAVPLA